MQLNNQNKITVELGEVQRTLLLPLWGRAKEFEKQDPIIRDSYASDLIGRLNYDFSEIEESFDEYYQVYWATRAYNIDCAVRRLIESYPDAIVVNIGAGLDTTFQRTDNGKILWYDLDLPDTIKLRKELIPESERNRYIAKSVFDRSWFDDINRGTKLFFIASGVFCYFDKHAVKSLFLDMIREFPDSEIIFELISWLLIRLSNLVVRLKKDKVGMAYLKWGGASSEAICKWSSKIKMLDEYSVFSRIRINENWKKSTISRVKKMNTFKRVKMVHLKFCR